MLGTEGCALVVAKRTDMINIKSLPRVVIFTSVIRQISHSKLPFYHLKASGSLWMEFSICADYYSSVLIIKWPFRSFKMKEGFTSRASKG